MKFRGRYKRADRQGMVLVIALFVLVIGALVAVLSLTSSRQNVVSSGQQTGHLEADYNAQAAINRALTKIRNDADWYWVNDALDPDPEPAKGILHKSFNPAVHDPTILTDCRQFYTWTDTDHTDANQIEVRATGADRGMVWCNFLKDEFPNVRVSIVRQQNFNDLISGQIAAVYVVTALSKTESNRGANIQALVVYPIVWTETFSTTRDPQVMPFIVSTTYPY